MANTIKTGGIDLTSYDIIVINSSGGKDSQVMLGMIHAEAVAQNVTDRLVVVHADLGKMEWAGVRELAESQAKAYGIPFEAIARPQGDILAQVESRGMWPSSTARFCTSDHKRGQVGVVITKLVNAKYQGRQLRVLNCMGFRSEESPARAKRPILVRDARNSNTKRETDTWLPILDVTLTEVWDFIKSSKVEHHVAYDLGMPRLSCVFCIFAPKAALMLAGRHNPELLAEYVRVERKIGHTFKNGESIESIQDAIAAGADDGEMGSDWNM